MMKRISLAAAAVTFMGALAVPVRAADVHVGIHLGVPAPPPIVFEAPPRLVVVPGAPHVRYAPDVSVNFFAYGDRYYTYNDGNWFVAPEDRGPWTYVERRRVPRQILVVPTRYYHHSPPHYGGGHNGQRHGGWKHKGGHHQDGHHRGRGHHDH